LTEIEQSAAYYSKFSPTLHRAVTLTFDPLILNVCIGCHTIELSKKLSEIEQSAPRY